MANLNKVKETPVVREEEQRRPETQDERKKRLRKEQRGALRVSFKPDDDLVQIRIFEHDPDEEIGHDDSQVRDGRMLKMHRDLDIEDDEDESPADEELSPWKQPSRKSLQSIHNGTPANCNCSN